MFQQFHVAFAPVAESVVLAHDNGLHADALDQDFLDEGSRRQGREIHGEGDADQHVDAGLFDQFRFLFVQGDQGRIPVAFDDPDGMGIEGHGNGRPVHGLGPFDDCVKKGLVADVNPVEITDGDDCGFKRFLYGFDILYNLHDLWIAVKNEVDTKTKKI